MKKAKEIELNDFHKALNNRLVKKISEQSSMSPEESIEQIKRIHSRTESPGSENWRALNEYIREQEASALFEWAIQNDLF